MRWPTGRPVRRWRATTRRSSVPRPVVAAQALGARGDDMGAAIVRVAAALPLHLAWVDSRDEIFPAELPYNVQPEHSEPVQAAVHDLAVVPSGSRLLIMSFSHAEDLEVCAAALLRQRTRGDLPFIGLIGSATKWATFSKRLAERGFSAAELAHITCPIGMPGIEGKEPGVIAVAVAAQLLCLPTMAVAP
jgi:xanthine dehydrogenase accessory factor